TLPPPPPLPITLYVTFPPLRIHSLTSTSFFFNDTATTEIYTLSLHDALPIWSACAAAGAVAPPACAGRNWRVRSEEHTSELQSLAYLVCRLLLEKKKTEK